MIEKNNNLFMKTKRGSILVYALIILMMMTAISVIETKTTLFEKKSVGITEISTQAYQTSDSGAQMGIKLINSVTVADATLSDVFYGDYSCETDTEGYAIVEVNDTGGIMGSSYKLTFFDGDEDMGGNQLGCEDFINDIELIKSVGTHKDAVRAVEVSVNRTMLSDSEGSGDDEIGGTDPEDDGIGSEEPGDGETGGTNPCGETTTLSHGGLTYGTVAAEDGRCWLDRNLGATRVATAYNDSGAYGWYYQWGRGTDGHQVPSSEVSNVCSSTDNVSDPADTGGTVNDGKFITDVTCYPGALDWRNPKNDNL